MQSLCGVAECSHDAGQPSSEPTPRRLQRRSHGEYSTPRKVCYHVGMDPNRPAQIRETRISTVTLRSLFDEKSTQCHVVCGRGWTLVPCLNGPRHPRLKHTHADIPPTVLYPRTTNSHFRRTHVVPVGSRQNPPVSMTLICYFTIATESFGAHRRGRESAESPDVRLQRTNSKRQILMCKSHRRWLLLSLDRDHDLVVRRRSCFSAQNNRPRS